MSFWPQAVEAIGRIVLKAGFEKVGDGNLYRFTAITLNSPMPQHNVFVSVETSGVEVMAPVGPADDYNETDLVVARNPNDGYRSELAGSQIALVRLLDDDAVRANPQHIFDSAANLAEYAGYVEHTLAMNRTRKFELAHRVGAAVTDPKFFEDGKTTPEQLADEVDEVIRLIPVEGFWAETIGYVNNSLMMTWASGPGTMRDTPWYPVQQRLERIGAERGWKLA